MLPAGIVSFTFATEVEGDFATATLEMPDGTTAEQTYEVARELEAAGHRAIDRVSENRPADAPPLLSGVTIAVGQRPRVEGGGLSPNPNLNPEPNVATIAFKLLDAQHRRIPTGDVVQAWREEVGVLPHVRGLTISGRIYDLGNPVEAVLSHPDPERLPGIATSVVNPGRSLSLSQVVGARPPLRAVAHGSVAVLVARQQSQVQARRAAARAPSLSSPRLSH